MYFIVIVVVLIMEHLREEPKTSFAMTSVVWNGTGTDADVETNSSAVHFVVQVLVVAGVFGVVAVDLAVVVGFDKFPSTFFCLT